MILNPDDSKCLLSRYEVSYGQNSFPSQNYNRESSFIETTVVNNTRLTAETHFQVFKFKHITKFDITKYMLFICLEQL